MIRTLVSILLLAALVGFAVYSEVRQITIASRQERDKVEEEEKSARRDQETDDQPARSTINTNLLTEAGWGHTVEVELLLESGANVNAKDANGDTALIVAASLGFDAIIHLLLDHGADVNAQNNAGSSALMEAAVMNRPATVALLIASGAKRETKNMAELSAVDLARRENHFEIVTMLESGVIAKSKQLLPSVGLDAELQQAAAAGDIIKTKELLARGANVNSADKSGRTPLMYAATEGHADVVEALLTAGANLNAKDKTGETAMSVVMQSGNNHIGRLLKRAGAKTPLYNQVVSQPQN